MTKLIINGFLFIGFFVLTNFRIAFAQSIGKLSLILFAFALSANGNSEKHCAYLSLSFYILLKIEVLDGGNMIFLTNGTTRIGIPSIMLF